MYRAAWTLLCWDAMHLKILGHPVFTNLNFHMPMIVDLSHPLIMLRGENGAGKSTLLQAIFFALRGDQAEGYVYSSAAAAASGRKARAVRPSGLSARGLRLFDAEQHNPRTQLDLFKEQPDIVEFLRTASHGQVMLSLFRESFPKLPDGTTLLLDEPEMALSVSNQRRVLKMLQELVHRKKFRIVCATHSPVLIESPETYVINLDRHINRNVLPDDLGIEDGSTIQ